MDNFYFKLLEKAGKDGIGKSTDISKEIKNHFLDNNNIPDIQYTTLNKNVDIFLRSIAYEDFIKYENKTPEINFASNTDCLDHIRATITITPKGLLFLYEKIKINGVARANRLTGLFILCTIIIGAWNLYFSNKTLNLLIKDDAYKEELKSVRIQKAQTEQKLLLLQVKFDSISRQYHNTVSTNSKSPKR